VVDDDVPDLSGPIAFSIASHPGRLRSRCQAERLLST
jgi:hypothetical protein